MKLWQCVCNRIQNSKLFCILYPGCKFMYSTQGIFVQKQLWNHERKQDNHISFFYFNHKQSYKQTMRRQGRVSLETKNKKWRNRIANITPFSPIFSRNDFPLPQETLLLWKLCENVSVLVLSRSMVPCNRNHVS